ncbi:MAG: bifunctional phosphoribosylaminoimidazolecarboxamide formyltransferase/IMP cyclohydrolase [Planctomycetota bacterium]
MTQTHPIRRALLSVSDKRGITEIGAALHELGIDLLSTGGTARALREAGLPVTDVADVTGSPEMLGGRVKTLHPAIHGGLLGRRDLSEHIQQMREHAIDPIDLLIVNLYPFEATIAKPGVTDEEAIEQIDIGGPAMIRSAAKNHASVTVVTEPAQYAELIDELGTNHGSTSPDLRRRFAAAAFARTSAYDHAITAYLSNTVQAPVALPESLTIELERNGMLRYGENPHQPAAVYRRTGASPSGVLGAEQLHGKALSYNNIADASAAWAAARTIDSAVPGAVAAVIVKHANPCGAARAGLASDAIDAAFAGDPTAAFGGILAVTSEIDAPAAQRLCAEGVFLEVVVAPEFSAQAIDRLRDRWTNLRLLRIRHDEPVLRTVRLLPGGAIVQTPDRVSPDAASWKHAAGPEPSSEMLAAGATLEPVAAALASNAVAVGGIDPGRTGCVRLFGAGAGQMDRVTACRLAVEKAGTLARGAIAISDAFFPFSDGPELLSDAGVAMIVHPGGSKRDGDTFRLCEERGVTCMTTGTRHFRHEPLS